MLGILQAMIWHRLLKANWEIIVERVFFLIVMKVRIATGSATLSVTWFSRIASNLEILTSYDLTSTKLQGRIVNLLLILSSRRERSGVPTFGRVDLEPELL